MTVDTAHATEATTAVHTPKARRSGCAASERTLTISAIPLSVRSEPTIDGQRERLVQKRRGEQGGAHRIESWRSSWPG